MIYLKRLNVQSWGPVALFDEEFAPFTLIYGKNESGKTSIVEALLSVLSQAKPTGFFKGKLRPFEGYAELVVSIDGSDKTLRYPPPKRKAGALLKDDHLRLAFVRAGETDIAENAEFKDYIARLVQPKRLLEWDVLAKTGIEYGVDGARLSKRGAFARLVELMEDKKALFRLRDELETLGQAGVIELRRRRDLLKRQKDELAVKRFAYGRYLLKEMADVKARLEEIPAEKIDRLKEARTRYRTLKAHMFECDEKLGVMPDEDEIFYFQSALDEARKMNKPKAVLYGAATIAMFLIALAVFLFMPAFAAISFVLVGCSIAFAFLTGRVVSTNSKADAVLHECSNRSGVSLRTIQDLEGHIKGLERQMAARQTLSAQRDSIMNEIKQLDIELETQGIEINDLDAVIRDLEEQRVAYEKRQAFISNELARLGIDGSDMPSEGEVADSFDFSKERIAVKAYDEAEKALKEAEERVRAQIAEAAAALKMPGEKNPKALFMALEEAIARIESEERALKEELLARLFCKGIITELERRRDNLIKERLNSRSFLELVEICTGGVKAGWSFDWEYGDLVMADEKGAVARFADMSTGARQQIMLAWRLAFLRDMAGSSFVVFDDAFQFSDWERRHSIARLLARLVGANWQIICFTMDDHVKKILKDSIGKKDRTFYKEILL